MSFGRNWRPPGGGFTGAPDPSNSDLPALQGGNGQMYSSCALVCHLHFFQNFHSNSFISKGDFFAAGISNIKKRNLYLLNILALYAQLSGNVRKAHCKIQLTSCASLKKWLRQRPLAEAARLCQSHQSWWTYWGFMTAFIMSDGLCHTESPARIPQATKRWLKLPVWVPC